MRAFFFLRLSLIVAVIGVANRGAHCFAPLRLPISHNHHVLSHTQGGAGLLVDSVTTALYGKKAKRKGATGGGGKSARRAPQQPQQEKQSVQDARFDAATRQFMFTLVGLTKVLPDKSKTILKNINLSFYPGAKIGVVGLNGSGKSTLLRIMAGLDTEYDGLARPLPGASIGYLEQEPELRFDTVQECIDEAVQSSQAILNEYTELSMKIADPDLTSNEMDTIVSRTEQLTNQIEAGNLWELDRMVERAMDSLRVPPGDAQVSGTSPISFSL